MTLNKPLLFTFSYFHGPLSTSACLVSEAKTLTLGGLHKENLPCGWNCCPRWEGGNSSYKLGLNFLEVRHSPSTFRPLDASRFYMDQDGTVSCILRHLLAWSARNRVLLYWLELAHCFSSATAWLKNPTHRNKYFFSWKYCEWKAQHIPGHVSLRKPGTHRFLGSLL